MPNSFALRYMTLHYAPLSYTTLHSPTLRYTLLHQATLQHTQTSEQRRALPFNTRSNHSWFNRHYARKIPRNMQTNERRRSVPSTMCLNRSSFPPPSTRLLYSSPALLPEKLYYASPQPSCNITPYLRLPARPALSSANTTSEHATRHVDDRASLSSPTCPNRCYFSPPFVSLVYTFEGLFPCSTTLRTMANAVPHSTLPTNARPSRF